MISIVICSKNNDISDILKKNIQDTIGVHYELIVIDNSRNDYSIFSAYNNGIKTAKYPFICFIHDDILFHTNHWGEKLITHLKNPTTGLVGVAGTCLTTRIPAPWPHSPNDLVCKNIIQSGKRKKKSERIKSPLTYQESRREVTALDGMLLSGRSEIFQKINFNENLNGFHGYDYDISLKALALGLKNYVLYDILLEHASGGNTNKLYFQNIISVYQNWETMFPLICNDTGKEYDIQSIEEMQLKTLIKKTARKGFSTTEIEEIANYYTELLEKKRAKKIMKYLHLRIFFIRLFSAPQYLLK